MKKVAADDPSVLPHKITQDKGRKKRRGPRARSRSVPSGVVAVTAAQLAGLLQLSDRAVYQLGKRGVVPGRFRVGRATRFDLEAVRAWIREGCPGSEDGGPDDAT